LFVKGNGMRQEEMFVESEGDAFYLRNKDNPKYINQDPIISAIESIEFIPESVFEIGCGTGWRLNELKKSYQCQAEGIDSSGLAIKEGKKLYPDVTLRKSTATNYDTQGKNIIFIIFKIY
jgi:trans-aconitate methyltransferase